MSPDYNWYLLAADAVLIIHFLFICYIVFGLFFIWIGHYLKLRIVKNLTFRISHISAMGFVLCESQVGMICPLTEWENLLRVKGGEEVRYEISFIAELFHKIIFYNFSMRTFIITYFIFFALMLISFRIVPPDKGKGKHHDR